MTVAAQTDTLRRCTRWGFQLAVCGVLVAASACSDEAAPHTATAKASADTTAVGDAEPSDATTDLGRLPGLDGSVSGDAEMSCPGGPGCACTSNGDCQTGFCIDIPQTAGKTCARKCEQNCPDGFLCTPVTGSGGDILNICVAQFGHLCEPCASSKDCESLGLKDALCVDQGALGRYCGVACKKASDCPGGYVCQNVQSTEGATIQQCVRSPDADQQPFGVCPCSLAAVAKKLQTVCGIVSKDGSGQVTGTCPGVRTCLATGLTPCTGEGAKSEVCNGVDDDCDGLTDESSCDDGNPCTQDTCGGSPIACQHKPLDEGACDADGSTCTEGDHCAAGTCTVGKKKSCDDANPCTLDECELAKGCTHTADDGAPCDDDNLCTQGDLCKGGLCLSGKPKTCDSFDACTFAKCDLLTGKCKPIEADAGTPCDDGSPCTDKDACKQGICKGLAKTCDDGNDCTSENCDAKLGCQSVAVQVKCSDGNACTVGDVCQAGTCVGIATDATKACDDGSPCTVDSCSPVVGCAHAASPDGTPCNDVSICTDADACKAGQCTGTAKSCDDGNACTTDSCDAKTGCSHALIVAGCDDGNACTSGDSCQGALCVGTPINVVQSCDDGNPCSVDSCVPASGCIHNAIAEGSPCSTCGVNACTCSIGKCVANCSPVPGGWSAWTYGACSAVCGGGTQVGTRVCNNPAPSCGGAVCTGPATINQACNTQACPPPALAKGTTLFDTPGQITKLSIPAGSSTLQARLWGGGGGGGTPGSGGGAGYVYASFAVTPGDEVEIRVAEGGPSDGGGGGASYLLIGGAFYVVAGAGGGGGSDGCGGCSGDATVGAGGPGGQAGGAGGAGSGNPWSNTGCGGGQGGNQIVGGSGGVCNDVSGQPGCVTAGGTGLAHTGGGPALGYACKVGASALGNKATPAAASSGTGGGGGSGWFGGGGGGSKNNYSGGGGGGGASWVNANKVTVQQTFGGTADQPGGTAASGYNGKAGKGGAGKTNASSSPQPGAGGLVILVL